MGVRISMKPICECENRDRNRRLDLRVQNRRTPRLAAQRLLDGKRARGSRDRILLARRLSPTIASIVCLSMLKVALAIVVVVVAVVAVVAATVAATVTATVAVASSECGLSSFRRRRRRRQEVEEKMTYERARRQMTQVQIAQKIASFSIKIRLCTRPDSQTTTTTTTKRVASNNLRARARAIRRGVAA